MIFYALKNSNVFIVYAVIRLFIRCVDNMFLSLFGHIFYAINQ